MKKGLIFILVLVAAAAVCVVSCPDKSAHSEALEGALKAAISEELSDGGNTEYDSGMVEFLSILGKGIGGLVLDGMLNVENYFVCSIGTISYEGETKVVSVGLLNHVFTPGKEKLKEYLRF